MTISPQMRLRAQATVTPGEGVTSGSFTAGFSETGDNSGADIVWTSTVTLPQWTGVKMNLGTGAYSKVGSPTVTDGLLNGEDLDGVPLALSDSYTLGVRVRSGTGYAANPDYACYLGRYAGAIGDWTPAGQGAGTAFETLLGPGNAMVLNASTPDGLQWQDWCLYNVAANSATVEVFVMGAA